jgi:hypothetical protein
MTHFKALILSKQLQVYVEVDRQVKHQISNRLRNEALNQIRDPDWRHELGQQVHEELNDIF